MTQNNYKLVSTEYFTIISGPCAIESEKMAMTTAEFLKSVSEKLNVNFKTNVLIKRDSKINPTKKIVIIKNLFSAYNNDINLLPKDFYTYNLEKINSGFKERVICDYIAGMTDRFAQQEHKKLFK